VLQSVSALVGCIAGAVLVEQTRSMVKAAGLTEIVLTPKADYVDGMLDWNDPLYQGIKQHIPAGVQLSDYVTSLYIEARKPAKNEGRK